MDEAQLTMKLPNGALLPIGTIAVNISPDGKFMLFVVQSGVGSKIVLRPSDHEDLETVLGSEVVGCDGELETDQIGADRRRLPDVVVHQDRQVDRG